jgi:hypothetical protein
VAVKILIFREVLGDASRFAAAQKSNGRVVDREIHRPAKATQPWRARLTIQSSAKLRSGKANPAGFAIS